MAAGVGGPHTGPQPAPSALGVCPPHLGHYSLGRGALEVAYGCGTARAVVLHLPCPLWGAGLMVEAVPHPMCVKAHLTHPGSEPTVMVGIAQLQ